MNISGNRNEKEMELFHRDMSFAVLHSTLN